MISTARDFNCPSLRVNVTLGAGVPAFAAAIGSYGALAEVTAQPGIVLPLAQSAHDPSPARRALLRQRGPISPRTSGRTAADGEWSPHCAPNAG